VETEAPDWSVAMPRPFWKAIKGGKARQLSIRAQRYRSIPLEVNTSSVRVLASLCCIALQHGISFVAIRLIIGHAYSNVCRLS